jgi:BASS family bile acid:Na+ symporter
MIFSVMAWSQPSLFGSFKTWIVPLLSVVMFGMGLTLRVADFRRALKMPKLIVTGIALQFSVMPLGALLITTGFQLDPVMTAGMVLVGASPGGTASNVICYLARGNVALAIKHFTTTAALPGAIFSIWHNLSGSVLAGFWSKRSTQG